MKLPGWRSFLTGLLDRVEQAFRMQRMFLSNVSHELRNPLTIIRSQLDVALQREREPRSLSQGHSKCARGCTFFE